MHRLASRCAVALALTLVFGCGTDTSLDDEAASTNGSVEHAPRASTTASERTGETRPKPRGAVKLPVLPTPVDLPAVTERSALLQRLPKSALFVLRLPHVEKLAEAFRRSALGDLMHSPEAAAQRASIEEVASRSVSALRAALPDFDALSEQALALEGESVFALVSVDITAFTDKSTRPNDMPFTLAWMFDAGAHASEFNELAERVLKSIEDHAARSRDTLANFQRESINATSWRARVSIDGVGFDLMREDNHFLLDMGPLVTTLPSEHASTPREHALALREIEDSFLAADITRGTKDLARGGDGLIVEAFLNLEPVWSAVELLAPADVKKIVAASGASSIRGMSAVAALGKSGIDEEVFLMSPGGKDLLTRCVTNRALEAAISQYIPQDASSATICTFDFTALFAGVTKLLPDSAKRDMDNALLDIKKSGFDLRTDLIENIGPTFAITGEFDPTRMFQSDGGGQAAEFTLVAQLQDGARLRGIIDALLARSGGNTSVHTKDVHGFKAYGTGPISLPAPDGIPAVQLDPHWYIGDDVFVFSLSRAALARSLAAAWRAENRGPRELGAALARESGAFAIGVNAIAGQAGLAETIGRRTSLGLELSTREGSGAATGYSFMTCAGIAAAVAIPSLIAARTEANERAVVSTLRSIAAAEKQFLTQRLLDADADGEGEHATLLELTGSIPLRSGAPALSPALLPPELAPGPDGLLRKNDYLFRIDLSKRLTRPIDFDEKDFFVYAWPEHDDGMFHRTFMIDVAGIVLRTDNDGAEQNYAGIERMPKPDAAKRVKSGSVKVMGNVPRSLDGGLWREL